MIDLDKEIKKIDKMLEHSEVSESIKTELRKKRKILLNKKEVLK